jgi:hypothetical protein
MYVHASVSIIILFLISGQQMLNTFSNDKAHVSVQWLIELVTKRGLSVRHLLFVKHESTGAVHYVAVLSDGRYICDCCMPSNVGSPCRHYFRIRVDVQNMPFHISLIRPRKVPLHLFSLHSLTISFSDGIKTRHLLPSPSLLFADMGS